MSGNALLQILIQRAASNAAGQSGGDAAQHSCEASTHFCPSLPPQGWLAVPPLHLASSSKSKGCKQPL